jgi:hypothetical protein
MRSHWIARLLANERSECARIMEPLARKRLRSAAASGQTVVSSVDQTDLRDRFAILMTSVRVGKRALPAIWATRIAPPTSESRTKVPCWRSLRLAAKLSDGANGGRPVLPVGAAFAGLHAHGLDYRLRLKGNQALDVGCADIIRTWDFARAVEQRFAVGERLFESGIQTNIGVLHEPGHPDPWIVAMECVTTAAAVRDDGLRWCIEPVFSNFESRGFGL